MPVEIVKMKARGFICVNAHPEGCRSNVERQIGVVRAAGKRSGFKNVLVVGASTGYGLASRIAAAWGFGARTLGVFFERPPEAGKPATAGYYNSVALHDAARRDGLWAASINGDAFSDEVKQQAVEIIRRDMGPIDLVVYSLASPRRTHPKTGVVHSSSLKPIGAPFSAHTIDLNAEKVVEVTIPPASEEEIAGAVAVMGGEDWRMWIHLLLEEKLLAPGARTVAYSYIGPSVTWPVYRDGTMGRAKQDLEAAATAMHERLPGLLGAGADAWVSVNKAVVTQASAAIPVVPLYMSLLPRVMKAKGLEEGCIEQMTRLLLTQIAPDVLPSTDSARRIRMDDREMRADVQEEVLAVFPNVTTESLHTSTDFPNFKREFQGLFGFNVEGVDYDQPVETDLALVNP
jgi:enoyl-[acyl-carrier protein] reductase/trans-2-enoyl-CoA reductase (NAD+)